MFDRELSKIMIIGHLLILQSVCHFCSFICTYLHPLLITYIAALERKNLFSLFANEHERRLSVDRHRWCSHWRKSLGLSTCSINRAIWEQGHSGSHCTTKSILRHTEKSLSNCWHIEWMKVKVSQVRITFKFIYLGHL